ncbi:hypothetical protein CUU63_20390 [Bacillus halotolerans]|uniref:Uncharacterized protein n=1 Tax=Bacillus halotolerans TaxID=260554 RepID=A0A9Q6A5Q8_9BACI|nr:hypothetical protein CUU63_20390 [Bacillus halotolerans]
MVSWIKYQRYNILHTHYKLERCVSFIKIPNFQDIFDEIVLQAINHSILGGRVLFTDFTYLSENTLY